VKLSRLLKTLLSLIFLFLLAAAVHYWIGWKQLFQPWQTVSPFALFSAMALVFTGYAVRAVRLYDYFLPMTQGRYFACLRLLLIHNALNNLLPMRSGELSFPLLMNRYFGSGLGRATGTLVWFRILDMHALAGVGLIVVGHAWLSAWGVLIMGVFWWSLPWWLFRALPSLRSGVFAILPSFSQALLERLYQGLPDSVSLFWRSLLWTQINWALKLAVFAWVLFTFLPLSWSQALAGVLGGELAGILPIPGFAGAGTYEAGIIAALVPFGYNVADVLHAAINLHLFMLGLSLLAAGATVFFPLPQFKKNLPNF